MIFYKPLKNTANTIYLKINETKKNLKWYIFHNKCPLSYVNTMSMFVLKTIVAGEGGIGKTSIVKSFMIHTFSKDYKLTIGVDISSKTMVFDNNSVTFSVHDIAGQKRFSEAKEMFMRGTHLALLVFDLTRKETLDNLLTHWVRPLIGMCPSVICILIGNKSDLADLRVFSESEGKETLKHLRKEYPHALFLQYLETSALYNQNINLAFETLGKKYLSSSK